MFEQLKDEELLNTLSVLRPESTINLTWHIIVA